MNFNLKQLMRIICKNNAKKVNLLKEKMFKSELEQKKLKISHNHLTEKKIKIKWQVERSERVER